MSEIGEHAGNGVARDDAHAEFLSQREVAALFDRTTRTIRNWVKAGYLRPRRIGRSVFFCQRDIDLLIGIEPDQQSQITQASKGVS